MHWPGVRQLWIAIHRKDIDVTKKQVEELVKTRGEKQVFGSLQKAEGKSLAEDVDARWQMDLADLKNQKVEHKTKAGESYSAFLVCIDCFSRQVWAKALKQKTQEEVKAKLSQIFAAAGHKPKVISSDNGQEFRGVLSEYLDEKLVVQRYKSVGDVNALGLVDRAIQQLKLKISEILSTRADKTWVDVLPDAVKALNSYPKDVLHGAAPKEVLGNPQVRFMLLEDQAKNATHNTQLTKRRAAKLTETGAYREPLPEATLRFKRGAQATYGEVRDVGNIRGSTVTDGDGRQMDIKRVKAVPITSSNAHGRFGAVNTRLQREKRERAGRIIVELCKLLEDKDQISLASAAVQMREKMGDYDAILAATSCSLVDIIRLAPEKVQLVPHAGSGGKDFYYVQLAQ